MSLYDEVKKHVVMSLRDKDAPNSDQIKQHISAVAQMQRQIGRTEEIDEDALHRDILSQVSTWQADPAVLRDGKHVNWLPARKAEMEIEWSFWKRYRQYLEEEKIWPSTVTAKLDKITDATLGDIGNPAQHGRWDRRGMVVGEVQSGKTANYTGLICKAVDAGYKLIVVLAGMTNDLRTQTQSRLDAEFLGFESEVGKAHSTGSRIGVGKIDAPGQLIAHPLTYSAKDGDFRANKSANLQLGGSPILLVVKKHTSVLKRILTWVQNQGKVHPATGKKIIDEIPLLLLDDEADNASVNTKKEDEDPTAINRAIRQILNSFQQSSYVGYTATPFANIFILPDEENKSEYGDDLFPKGFIYYISPPSNYVGPSQLFGLTEDLDGGDNTTDALPLVRPADDAEIVFPLSHKKELRVDELPDSLIEALCAFVITCAARRARGQRDVHNSMLIHVTRYNLVQRRVIELISTELINMQRIIEYNTGVQAARLFETLEQLWKKDYLPTCESVRHVCDDPQLIHVEWQDVRAQLLPAITKLQVRGINGDAGGVLDYDNNPSGLNVIAVGGDKLSRGLTLEGLSVSFYIRPAKNYDTLLQMGRWFGYRPGYVDLCRLYTTEDLIGWYEHIAVANEELRREFTFMELSRQTPEEYGLKVRTHPDGLNITAANKIRNGRKMRVSFSGHLSQTTVFHKDAQIHEGNFKAADEWLQSLSNPVLEKTRVVWKNVTPAQINKFLKGYTSHPMCRKAEPDLLMKYIEKLLRFGELNNWTVALISNSEAKATPWTISGRQIGLIFRDDKTPDDTSLYMLKKSNILSPQDEQLDLSDDQIAAALDKNIAAWQLGQTRSENEPKRPSGPFIRHVRSPQNGLLLIYPLDHSQFDKFFTSVPIIGFAISFPESTKGTMSAIEYQVNTTYWRERYGEDDEDDA
ncbi:Z1 domain-containing protein [Lacunimicrobium album]